MKSYKATLLGVAYILLILVANVASIQEKSRSVRRSQRKIKKSRSHSHSNSRRSQSQSHSRSHSHSHSTVPENCEIQTIKGKLFNFTIFLSNMISAAQTTVVYSFTKLFVKTDILEGKDTSDLERCSSVLNAGYNSIIDTFKADELIKETKEAVITEDNVKGIKDIGLTEEQVTRLQDAKSNPKKFCETTIAISKEQVTKFNEYTTIGNKAIEMVENHIREQRTYDVIESRLHNTFQWSSTSAAKDQVFKFLDEKEYKGKPWTPKFQQHLQEIKIMLYESVKSSEESVERSKALVEPDCSILPTQELGTCQKVGYLQKAKAALRMFQTKPGDNWEECLSRVTFLYGITMPSTFLSLANNIKLAGQLIVNMMGLFVMGVVQIVFLVSKLIYHVFKADKLSSATDLDVDEVSKYWGKAIGYAVNIAMSIVTAGVSLLQRRKMRKMRKFK